MNQIIVALLLKMKTRYPDKEVVLNELIKSFDPNLSDSMKWITKTGMLNNTTEELFTRLNPESREQLFTSLFSHLYPSALMSKHPQKNAYLFKIGETKFFYDINANSIVMPTRDEEMPRTFHAGLFFENMPKLEEFIKYLNTYSMRNRKEIRF